MCYLSRQSKRIKVLFNMVWSQTMKRYSFQWRIYKFNLQKVTSRKCFLSLSTAVFSYDNSIQTLYVANCFKSFTYFKWQRCIASDKFCFLFGPWSKIYICPLFAHTSKYYLNFSFSLLNFIVHPNTPTVSFFQTRKDDWSLFISFLFLTLLIKLLFPSQSAQRNNYFSFVVACPWFASTSFVYFETKP